MISTGTDVKPIECVFFMRNVKSAGFFEQMKGRGVRVISPDKLRAVTPSARAKERFIIVDAVGVCEHDKTESSTLNRQPSASLDELLAYVSQGGTDPDALTTLAGRLSRMQREFSPAQLEELKELAGSKSFPDLAHGLLGACDPDVQADAAKALPRSISDDDTPVNFVPMRAVDPEGGGLTRPEVRPYGQVKKGYTSFAAGDVIMAKITPCMENGKTAVVPQLPGSVCFGSTEFHVARPSDGITPNWIAAYLLQHDVRRAAQRAMGGGGGQMRVPASFLEQMRLPVAPAAEQIRIGDALDELLSDLDAGMLALERVRAKLAQYRASVLKAAVDGTLTAEWRAEHPNTEPAAKLLDRILAERRGRWEEEQLRKFKDKGQEATKNWKAEYKEPVTPETATLQQLPEGWCWATLGQTSFLQNGRPFPSREYQDSGTKLPRPGNLYANGAVVWTERNTRRMPDRHAQDAPDLIVGGGELLMNLTAQSLKDDFLGRVCITAVGECCLLNQRLARISAVLASPKFMLWTLKSARFRQFVGRLNTGRTTRPDLRPGSWDRRIPVRRLHYVLERKLERHEKDLDGDEKRALREELVEGMELSPKVGRCAR